MTLSPYTKDGSKREEVERMFDAISPQYDLLNRLFSLGIDQGWRCRVMRSVHQEPIEHLLDVATGTADMAILAAKRVPHVVGVDISEGMLDQGREKITQRGLQDKVTLLRSDSAALPFEDERFDAVTVAFGVRNFEHLERGISEMRRVLRPGGRLFVLEFSRPGRTPFKQIFRLYFHYIMPFFGRLISRDKAAYTYLPKSVELFPEGDEFLAIMTRTGLKGAQAEKFTGGVATLYVGRK